VEPRWQLAARSPASLNLRCTLHAHIDPDSRPARSSARWSGMDHGETDSRCSGDEDELKRELGKCWCWPAHSSLALQRITREIVTEATERWTPAKVEMVWGRCVAMDLGRDRRRNRKEQGKLCSSRTSTRLGWAAAECGLQRCVCKDDHAQSS
jgi:hypothetical protein